MRLAFDPFDPGPDCDGHQRLADLGVLGNHGAFERCTDKHVFFHLLRFAFAGFEITSIIGKEIENPEVTIPRGVFIAGAIVTVVYILGSASVLFAIPVSSLKELSGITDAVQLVTGRVGLSGLGTLTGALLVLNALAGTASWTAGAARVPFAAGVDAAMPRAFAAFTSFTRRR